MAAGEKNSGLQAQTTFNAGRPGVLTEPEPLGSSHGYVAAPVPLLAVPLLAGTAGEAVDARTLRFLLARPLAEKEEEEEQRKVDFARQVEELRQASLARAEDLDGSKRKRKKRRKKKPPRTSSSFGRPLRRHRQCCVHGWFSWCCSSRCVLSFGRQAQDATPGPLCTRSTVISGLCMAGFAGYVTFALCSLLLSVGHVSFFLDKLLSPVVVQRQVPVLVWTVLCVARGESTGAVLGRGYGHFDKFHGPDSTNCLKVPQVQLLFKDVDISYCGAEADPHGPGEIPQLPFSWCPCCALQHPCRGAEAFRRGPDGSSDH